MEARIDAGGYEKVILHQSENGFLVSREQGPVAGVDVVLGDEGGDVFRGVDLGVR